MNMNNVEHETITGNYEGIEYTIEVNWFVSQSVSRYYKYSVNYEAKFSFNNEEYTHWHVNRYEDRIDSLKDKATQDFGYDHHNAEQIETQMQDTKKRLTQNLIYRIETNIRSYYAKHRYQQFEQGWQYPDTVLKYTTY